MRIVVSTYESGIHHIMEQGADKTLCNRSARYMHVRDYLSELDGYCPTCDKRGDIAQTYVNWTAENRRSWAEYKAKQEAEEAEWAKQAAAAQVETDKRDRLNAAAPDLLEALRDLAAAAARIVEDDDKPTMIHMRELDRQRRKAIDAIAKAEEAR